MSTHVNIRLVGPGSAGKSTIGAPLAARLHVPFFDLDRHFAARFGDISGYINRHGYEMYARENIETYRLVVGENSGPGVIALSSGFMTYPRGAHPDYARIRGDLERHPDTFVLLPSLDRDVCVAETVRRQIARPFARSSAEEEAVIRDRFDVYIAMPLRKVETMRGVAEVVDEIEAAYRTIME